MLISVTRWRMSVFFLLPLRHSQAWLRFVRVLSECALMRAKLSGQEWVVLFAMSALGVATGVMMLHDMQIVHLEMADFAGFNVLNLVRRLFGA